MRILIVEDDEVDRIAMDRWFGGEHILAFADCGAAAVGLSREFAPELVLCDLRLPDVVAMELVGNFRAKGFVVIAMSGLVDQERAAAGVIEKTEDALRKAINETTT